MKLILDIRKTLEQNAGEYFDRAKKAKKKIEMVHKIIAKYEGELQKLGLAEKMQEEEQEAAVLKKSRRVQKWYHKFRWFKTSEGFLVIGGRDASSNEIAIKKYAAPGDIVCHTDMQGSPFLVLKHDTALLDGKPVSIGEKSIQEIADATATFSKAWKLGFPSVEVGIGKPEQFSKQGPSGEYVPHGGFVISGKLVKKTGIMNLAIGLNEENEIVAGPVDAVRSQCTTCLILISGKEKPSAIAKTIKKKIGGEIDAIVRALPAGMFKVSD